MKNLFDINIDIEIKAKMTFKPSRGIYMCDDVSRRFAQSAAVMAEDEFIGWQVDFSKEKTYEIFAFSSRDAHITVEDFAWIFEEIADTETAAETFTPKKFDKNSRAYSYSQVPKGGCEFFGGEYDSFEEFMRLKFQFFNGQLFDWLRNIEASIRFIAGLSREDDSKIGAILFILPSEMPTRTKAMLSLAFESMFINEVGGNPEKESELLCDYYFTNAFDTISRFLIKQGRKYDEDGFFDFSY